MAMVYWCVVILTVDVVFFRTPGVLHSQDSFPSTVRPQLWETSSGVVAAGVFAAVAVYCRTKQYLPHMGLLQKVTTTPVTMPPTTNRTVV